MFPRSIRSLSGLLLGFLCLSAPALAAPPGVDLLSATGGTVRFGLLPGTAQLEPSASDPARVSLRVDGWDRDAEPGQPRLPLKAVRVAVPPTGDVQVAAFGSETEVRDGVSLEINPSLGGPVAPSALGNARPIARVTSVSWLRNQRVATIEIRPAEYDVASRRLTTHGRVEIELRMQGATTARAAYEADDPFESVYQSVLVNYEQGKGWRRPAAEGLREARPQPLDGTALPDTSSIFVGHTWVKIAIPQSGFYRINYGQLRALFPFTQSDSIPFSDIRLYSWPGRPNLPERNGCDGCDYRQVAIGIEDVASDGKLSNNQDAFYFYALGPNDWADHYDPTFPDSMFIRNPYENNNYVFLSFQRVAFGDLPFTDTPARIAANLNVTPVDDGTENHPTTFLERLRFETESGNEYNPGLYRPGNQPDGLEPWSWEKFMWRSITLGGQFTMTARTPGADPSATARFRMRAWGNGATDTQRCTDNNTFPHYLDVIFRGGPAAGTYDSTRFGFFEGSALTVRKLFPVDTLNALTIRIPSPPIPSSCRVDRTTMSWFEIYYRRRFLPENDQLSFDSPGNGNAIYSIGPFQDRTLPRMFDVTDPFAPREMFTDSAAILVNTGMLPIEVNETGRTRYAIFPSGGFLSPTSADFTEASQVSLDNLRSTDRSADFIDIYYDGYFSAAESLSTWRRARLPIASHGPPYHTASVPISAIYDQFSGGRTDPAAIRNFLRSAFFNWHGGGHPSPTFVTLLGDASFDFRNLLGLAGVGQPASPLPAFENNVVSSTQFATDDWLYNMDVTQAAGDAVPDYFGGRIPAFDVTSANDYVRKKIFPYERSSPTGVYRDRIMLIADDDQQGDSDDDLKWKHLEQTADIDRFHMPDHFDRSYVYLHTYPDGPGRTKPAAKADIKSTINGDGVVIFNYIGHGSPFKLSDENVLIDVDAGTFSNISRLPLFVAASCDVGKFNDPRVQSLGERLLTSSAGGTIGVISATELAFSDFNVRLANDFYDALFLRDAGSGQFNAVVAPALLAAKLLNSASTFAIQNNQKYGLLGDAALTLDFPKLWVNLSLFDETGTTPITQIQSGQTVMVRGTVTDRAGAGATLVPYSGVVDLLIEDSQPLQTAPPCAYAPACFKPQYDFRAGAIYRGDVIVTNGAFQAKFVVPIEAATGTRGKVRAYAAGYPLQPPQTDGVGSIRMPVVAGTAPTGDREGPVISLTFPGGVTSVRPDATLRIELTDPSGILTTGHTVQNGIVVTVDNNTTARVDVTSSFRYTANSYTSGAAIFDLPNLSQGPHNIRVSAADNLAGGLTALEHRSTASIDFEVVSTPPIAIRNAYLFPNPTESGRRTSGGQFVIDGPGDSVNVLVRIFTVSGRMIRELKSLGQFGQVQVTWDGLDAEGYPLANGTYLFKVYVNGRDEKGRSTARQKASREGKIVILNH